MRALSFLVPRRRRQRTHPRRWPWALAGLACLVVGGLVAEFQHGLTLGVRLAEAIR